MRDKNEGVNMIMNDLKKYKLMIVVLLSYTTSLPSDATRVLIKLFQDVFSSVTSK